MTSYVEIGFCIGEEFLTSFLRVLAMGFSKWNHAEVFGFPKNLFLLQLNLYRLHKNVMTVKL